MTTEVSRRDIRYGLGVEVVALANQQRLEVEHHESSEAGLVEMLRFD
ncbi:hypothetical protein LT974_07680 [Halobacterium noricense]|nr:hypothetical protein [Halobacterium noricense]UHH26800.1 hypothetical protein LT974_07680 [Halobacterium noricense]